MCNVCCNNSKIGSDCTESTPSQEEAAQGPQSENNNGCSIGGLKVKLVSSDHWVVKISANGGKMVSAFFAQCITYPRTMPSFQVVQVVKLSPVVAQRLMVDV